VFLHVARAYSKIFRDIPSVGPNAISKKSNNVVISSPRDFIFSRILVPKDSFPYIWSLDLERFRIGRQGAPKIFFRIRFSRQPLVLSPTFFQGRVPPEAHYLSSGGHGVGGQIWGSDPPKNEIFFIFSVVPLPGLGGENCRMEIIVTGDPFDA